MTVRALFAATVIAASSGLAGFDAPPAAPGGAPGGAWAAQNPSRDGQNRRVRVHNQTGVALQKLQAADVRTGTFGADLLGGTAVAAGASTPVLIDDGAGGCLYDLKAELTGGQTLLRENINVCRIADYYLTR